VHLLLLLSFEELSRKAGEFAFILLFGAYMFLGCEPSGLAFRELGFEPLLEFVG
jgi:hypothetical protein